MTGGEEVWKQVSGYEGLYAVSNLGNVMSLPRTISRINRKGTQIHQSKDGIILKGGFNGHHVTVSLCKDGICKRKNVHILVAEAFLPPKPNKKSLVCHRNGKGWDNREDNLRWGTQKENIHDRVEHGTHSFGVNNPKSKYTVDQILEVKELLKTHRQSEVSRLTGIPDSTIGGIKQGKIWADIDQRSIVRTPLTYVYFRIDREKNTLTYLEIANNVAGLTQLDNAPEDLFLKNRKNTAVLYRETQKYKDYIGVVGSLSNIRRLVGVALDD